MIAGAMLYSWLMVFGISIYGVYFAKWANDKDYIDGYNKILQQ